MSVANANAFALLDDEGTVDVGVLAAKLPVAKKEAPVKSDDASKPSKHWVSFIKLVMNKFGLETGKFVDITQTIHR